jgi:hypothetical protein
MIYNDYKNYNKFNIKYNNIFFIDKNKTRLLINTIIEFKINNTLCYSKVNIIKNIKEILISIIFSAKLKD